jgi:hypothetical protein
MKFQKEHYSKTSSLRNQPLETQRWIWAVIIRKKNR